MTTTTSLQDRRQLLGPRILLALDRDGGVGGGGGGAVVGAVG